MRKLLILLITSLAFSTAPDIEWSQTYGGSAYEEGESVQQTTDGGYIAIGSTMSFGNGITDVWLIKTDSDGDEEWNQTFGGSGQEEGKSVQQTSDDGYIIVGYTTSNDEADVWIIKTDSDGNEEWNRTFGGNGADWGYSVQQTIDGGYIIAGQTSSFGNGQTADVWLIKTDSDGDEEWNQTFGGDYSTTTNSVQQTIDGGYIIAGRTDENIEDNQTDVWLIKTDSNGNEEWSQTYGGSGYDAGESVQQTTDGGYIIIGYTRSFGEGEDDVLLIKTDSDGLEEWNQTFGGDDDDLGLSVQQTTDGGYIIGGYTKSFGNGNQDVWLIKTDTNGNEEWNQTFGESWNDKAKSVQQTMDGGYIIGGMFEGDSYDLWLIKLEPEITEGCTHPNASNYDEEANVDDGSCQFATVQIGHQSWMTENLKVTHYNNGDAIPTGLDNSTWSSTTEGAYAVYDDDPANAEVYGNLYNWYVVDDDRGVCPENYHVPSDDEYTILTDYLGGIISDDYILDVAGKMKESGLEHWNSPNTGATNESGFTALPAGYRNGDIGIYDRIGNRAYFWTSTEYFGGGIPAAYFRELVYYSPDMYRYGNLKDDAFSIRCLSDELSNTTIHVPEDFATIQEAIDYSMDGDSILVSAGTYYENIVWPQTNNVTLISVDGPDFTTIDGSLNEESCIYMENSEIEINDWCSGEVYEECGDGLCNFNSCDNTIEDCPSDCPILNAEINGFKITGGSGSQYYSGSARHGAGIFIEKYLNVTIENSDITENGSIGEPNTDTETRGAISVEDYSILNLRYSKVHHNSVNEYGGVWFRSMSNLTSNIYRSLIYGNETMQWFDVQIHLQHSNVFFENSVVYGRFTGGYDCLITGKNSIIFNNETNSPGLDDFTSVQWDFDYSLGGCIPNLELGTTVCEDGNIYDTPQFTDPNNGDFTLQPTSPCIDTGNPESDLDPDGTIADMGAYPYEQYQNTIDLHFGANLVSFYAIPNDNSPDNIFSPIDGIVTGVIGQGTAASPDPTLGWVGSLTEIEPDKGYWVKVNDDVILPVTGFETDENIVYGLNYGANLISYPFEHSQDISVTISEEYNESITGIIGEGVAASYNPTLGWIGSLSAFYKNRGYWFISNEQFDFNYELAESSSRESNVSVSSEYNQSTQQAFYFIEDIENIEVGDIIKAYHGNVLVGSREWTGQHTDIPAMGNDNTEYSAGYLNSGDIPVFKVEKLNGEVISLSGDIPTWSNNEIFMLSYLSESVIIPEEYSLQRAYPNPFNPTTTINFSVPTESMVSLKIYDISGRLVKTLISDNYQPGYHRVTWNALDISSGVYFVKMNAGSFTANQKLMLIK